MKEGRENKERESNASLLVRSHNSTPRGSFELRFCFFFFFDTSVRSLSVLKMSSMRLHALPIIGFMFLALLEFGFGQGTAPSPAEGPSNDGKTIDQGIAYILLMLALAITYLFH
ncbi:arabinogalactan peptide [Populus alba x Populus x berolinensis]|nr:arabinogalactan peptide [Populus alba x Populus x berolinensis]